ncbi:hypothetical protein V6N13_006246 [Hibiscus sabdariffa]
MTEISLGENISRNNLVNPDDNSPGGDAFVDAGYRAWNKVEAFDKHVGGHMSAHNQALGRLNDFKNQKSSI